MTKRFWGAYLRNRFARIYPMYFILTTLTFAVIFFSGIGNYSDFENVILYFLNITFLRGFFDSFKYSGIVQGWSLTIEECFYILAPLLFVFVKPAKQWITVVLVAYLAGFILSLSLDQANMFGLFGGMQFTFYFTIFGRIFEFIAGMFLAKVCGSINIKPQRGYVFTLIGSVLILTFVFLLSLVTNHFKVQQAVFHPVGIFINNLLLPFGVVSLIYGLISEINWFSRCLSSPTFDLLGKSSYTFYLIHMGVIADVVISWFPWDRHFIPFVLLNLIAIALYKLVEKPLHQYFRSRKYA